MLKSPSQKEEPTTFMLAVVPFSFICHLHVPPILFTYLVFRHVVSANLCSASIKFV